ncbi:ferredoxin--nitrite reductase [Sulfurimonas autotrophica]|uniref:Ferredoxin--nitrite reductase n=1 Tax=Sulfurimonas autotrophica (strain ATCC BAA-671 / DSM 16294 / JCM 11897 / OK10) TaxID=563040 RepID=E0UQH3_SULAO|nr:ferredoxin--nitrite reductase [Sulfurimonas autotrophica]ADN08775.1 Ferredoxin--nitrite reductase [Sulfurimonas autotrophica DSM 16294]
MQLEVLEKAYEARNKKVNKIEKVKDLKKPMQAFEKITQYAKEGYDAIPDEDKKYFLKCFGIYDKDAQTPQQFMMRVRVSGGHLGAVQAKKIGEIAKEFGQDYIDITTRAQIELRFLNIEDMPAILAGLDAVGLTSYQTGVDNFRNIVTDPLDKDGFDNVLPSYNLLKKIEKTFLKNPDWISTLPRKFNTGISGSLVNRCNVFGHDCSLVLAQKDGVYGYNMFLGGKVGMIAKSADIFLTNEEEVLKAYGSLIEIFRKYGFRDNRNKNRLHFLIDAVGMPEISTAIREVAGVDFATAGDTMTQMNPVDSEHGKVQLRDGSFGVHVIVPSGIFAGSDLIKVAELSQIHGSGEIRFSVEQNIYILGVKDTTALLQDAFFTRYKNINTPYFNNLVACAGTKHCAFGVIENKADAIEMAEYLSTKVPLKSGRVRMYWSACVKGCGTHEIGDIGFEGCKTKVNGQTEDGVHITIGGKIVSEGKNGYTVIKASPLRFSRFFVETLILEYKKLRLKNESFEKFHDRVLSQYSHAYIGFYMQLQAYLRAKHIDINLDIKKMTKTGKNEEFEIFELGRKIYFSFSKQEAYSAYDRFTNENPREKLTNIKKILPELDENIANLLTKMLDNNESNRAVVFSELSSYINLA